MLIEVHSISGHKAFLGFFYLDYAYNNAVMHVFIENLKDSLDDDPNTPSSSGSPGMEEETDRIATHRFPPTSKSYALNNKTKNSVHSKLWES